MVRFFFGLIVLSYFSIPVFGDRIGANQNPSQKCAKTLAQKLNPTLFKEGGTVSNYARRFAAALKHLTKTTLYPFVAIPKGVYAITKGIFGSEGFVKTIKDTFRKDILHAALFMGMYLGSTASGVPFNDLDRRIDDGVPEDAIVVVVNGFTKSDPLHPYVQKYFKNLYGNNPNATYIEDDRGALYPIQQIIQTSNKMGKVQVLKVFGHGTPGTINWKGHTYVQDTFSLWDWKYIDWKAHESGYREHSHKVEMPRYDAKGNLKGTDLRHKLELTGVMDTNARLGLYACSTARGEEGTQFMEYFGATLSNDGITVYGSSLKMEKNIVDQLIISYGGNPMRIPSRVHQAMDFGFSGINFFANLVDKFAPDTSNVKATNNVFYVNLNPIKEVYVPPRQVSTFPPGPVLRREDLEGIPREPQLSRNP